MKLNLSVIPAGLDFGFLKSGASKGYTIKLETDTYDLRVTGIAKQGFGPNDTATFPAIGTVLTNGSTRSGVVSMSPDGDDWINGNLEIQTEFINTRSYGPLITSGLISNAYHTEDGRAGYFHPASGTSEGQTLMIYAAYLASEVLERDFAIQSRWYKDLAEQMLEAMYGPMIRQAIPRDPETITLLHWLFAAKGPVEVEATDLARSLTYSGGSFTVPKIGNGVKKVYQMYPASANLLYASPYSPAIGGGSVFFTAGQVQVQADGSATVTPPPGTPAGAYKLCVSYLSGQTIPRESPYEAYPAWSGIPDGYAACAPDTFRWADQALREAIRIGNPSKARDRQDLLNALRRTCVKGCDLTDLREVFKLQPGLSVFSASGMFCYSNHPDASNSAFGSGANLWSRNSSGQMVSDIPANDGTPVEVQIGRGVEDTWRGSTVYQDPDQYLIIELGLKVVSKASNGDFSVQVYVSSTAEYNTATRWAYTVPAGTIRRDAGGVVLLKIPRNELKKLSDSSVLPVGQTVVNFGVSVTTDAGYNLSVGRMRFVSGPSQAWVDANIDAAIRGSKLPYFPGSIPFAMNADLPTGNFVGYWGNPLHGYQLPDQWLFMEPDAQIVHGQVTPADVPVVASNGAIAYTLAANNLNGVAKPSAILLAEQQVQYLVDAQAAYTAKLGITGPYAHTFVINTPDRRNIGNPAPHTWVFTNDDPNSPWCGYQTRIVESLANLVWMTTGRPDAVTLRTKAANSLISWLTWLDGAWPNLSGSPYKGMPTVFSGDQPPQTTYEEPHIASQVLRGCAWLKMSNISPASNDLADRLMQRCWDYMETQWVSAPGDMQYTWSPDADVHQWYGFWHAEIIITMALLLGEQASARPAGISQAVMVDRLVKTQSWLNGEAVLQDASPSANVYITGSRRPLSRPSVDWETGYRVTYQYLTEILQSRDGSEQRIAQRQSPRKTLEYKARLFGDTRREFVNQMWTDQPAKFVHPEQSKVLFLDAPAKAGDVTLVLSETPGDWVRPGTILVFGSGSAAELKSVALYPAGNVLTLRSPVLGNWSVDTQIFQATIGRYAPSLTFQHRTDDVSEAQIVFEVTPASESEFVSDAPKVSFDGREVFDLDADWSSPMTITKAHEVEDLDFGRGITSRATPVRFGTYSPTISLLLRSKASAEYLRQFFGRQKGRQGEFWIKSPLADMRLRSDAAPGSNLIRVVGTTARDVFESGITHTAVAIILEDGLTVFAKVLSATTVGGFDTQFSLSTTFPTGLPMDAVDKVCWLTNARFGSDNLVIDWQTDDLATSRLAIISLRNQPVER